MRFFGAPPAEVMAGLGDERPLAWAAVEGGWVAGSRDALHLLVGEPARIPWERVRRADWNQDIERLEVEDLELRLRHFQVSEPGRLLELLRERVTASVVLQRWVSTGRRRGFHVVARRAPRGGDLAWYFDYGPGVDPDDPEVVAQARAALAEARAEVG